MADTKQGWQEAAAAKRASLLASIPSEWLIPKDILPAEHILDVTNFRKTSGLLTHKEIQITDAGAVDIVENISKGLWSAEEVALAFCKTAAIAHQLVDPRPECS
jgi:amidase